MKPATALALATGGTLLATGIAFKNGIDKLQYSLQDIQVRDGKPVIIIAVNNTNRFFSYPVPQLFLNVFNDSGTYLGSLSSSELQWIEKNSTSYLAATLLPNYETLGAFLSSIILSHTGLQHFNINGILTIAGYEVPLDTEINTVASA